MASAQIHGTSGYDQTKQRLEIFCKYFVDLYELKLEAYTMFIEGKLSKAGKFADFFSEKIGQGAGASLALFLPTFPTRIGTKLGKSIAQPIGKKLGTKFHGEKVNSVLHLLECWKKDMSGFREKLVEAALDLGQSFEMQFMFIEAELGGDREALRLVALDSVNRSFNFYEKIEQDVEHVTISESVLRGKSKIETVLGVPVNSKHIKTPGYTIYCRDSEWHTSSLFEKSGVVIDTANSKTYYKLKIDSKTSKYGYRRLLECEIDKWSKLKEKYEEESDLSKTSYFTDYTYMFSLGSEEFYKMKYDLLDHVNEKDPKLLEERMKKLMTEINESILQQGNNLLEVTIKNHEETVSYFNLASEERQELADANTSKHEVTQGMVARVVEEIGQLKNPASKFPRSFKYRLRACNLNYIKRYNANGLCKTDEINAHFYPNNVSSNDSDDSKSPIVIICGLGGVGKSEEGRQYCEFWWNEHKEYDRAVLWIDCTSFTSFIDTFKSLGSDLKIWTNVPKTETKIVEAIYSHFLDRETLFVFDNADEHIQTFLPHLVSLVVPDRPKLPYILMTSRTKSWDGANEEFAQFQLVELGVFTEREGLNYVKVSLKRSLEETAKDKDILDLCKLLHSLPLALRQAVAYIQAEMDSVGQYSIAEYIADYKGNIQKLLGFIPYNDNEERYPNPVLSTWLVTLEKIKNQDDGKAAQDIFNILAYLSPNAIEIHKILGISVTDNSSKKDMDSKAGIQLLSKYSMIDLDSDQRAYVHALVQEVVRMQMKKVSIVWQVALCLVFLSFLFTIANAIFSFFSELSDQLALTVGFISFVYVVSTSYNIEKPTIDKVLNLLRSEKVSQDCDTTKHVRAAWYYATDYSNLLFTHNFVIENWFPLNVSIRRYGPFHDTLLHILSFVHTKSAYNLLWYISLLAKLPKCKEYIRLIVNATNDARYTPLHVVCLAHSLHEMRTAEFLIKKGANIETEDDYKVTQLHCAALSDKVDMVELLIKKGASIKAEDDYKETPLHCALRSEKVDMAVLLIKQGANIEAENVDKMTPLHRAVLSDKVDMVELLIKEGASIEAEDKDEETPLHCALRSDKVDMAVLLIQQGANIEAENKGKQTPLHLAVYYDKRNMVELLIKQGANIEAKDVQKMTSLHRAVLSGKVDMAELLIKQGANIEAKDVHKMTPLHPAVLSGKVDIAELLIKHGANIEAEDKYEKTPLHRAVLSDKVDMVELLIKQGASIEAEDKDKETPLHCALRSDKVDIAELLIKHGANIEAEDKYGKTPLHRAVFSDKVDMAELLIKQGANIEAEDKDKETPLHWAVRSDKVDMAELLIKQGANIEAEDKDKETPLHLAVDSDKVDMVELLIKQGANIEAADVDKVTPLHCAVFSDKVDMADILIKKGANIEAKDVDKETALHWAVYYDKRDMAELLIKRGANIEAKDENLGSPLHGVVRSGKVDMAELLIKYGANIEAKDKDGKTPLHCAVLSDKVDMAELLIKQGADFETKYGSGGSPLYWAVRSDKRDMVELLVNHGAKIEADDKVSSLHHAVLSGKVDIAQLLIKHGANIEAQYLNEGSSLHCAVRSGKVDMAELLIKYGANIEAKDKDGKTPLYCALLSDKVDMAELLIKQGADIEAKYGSGGSPLYWAVRWDKVDMVELLIKHGANIETEDEDRKTPLHRAVLSGKVEIAELLIKHGANMEAEDGNGRSPLHSAVLSGKLHMVELLKKHGNKL